MTAWAALVLVVAIGLVGIGWWLAQQPPCMRQRVIVNLKSDRTTGYQGVLWQTRGAWFVLRDVTALPTEGPPRPWDGEMIIHRSNVESVQRWL